MRFSRAMGSIYSKRGKLWLRVKIDGKWRDRTTGLPDTEEGWEQAREVLRLREGLVAVAAEAGTTGPLTVAAWSTAWLKRHEGEPSHRDDTGRVAHLLPLLGEVLLEDLRPRHVRAALRTLRQGELAPRTIHHVYSVLRRMLREAAVDDLVTGTPWTILRGDLPPKRDAVKGWREGALFTPAEIDQLATDERIPEDRRTLYALAGYAGLRFGEAAALRWSAITDDEPLGRLRVDVAWDTHGRREKGTKAERPRVVPVHPSLAARLRVWRIGGWARALRRGSNPEPGDLVVPSRTGNHRPAQRALRYLHRDLERLELRADRRFHDLRRSWITWARDSGAPADHVRWISHGPGPSVLDSYTSTPWAALCAVLERMVAARSLPALLPGKENGTAG